MMLNWLKSFSTQLRTVAYIIIRRFLLHCSLDTIGQETEDGTSPQKHGETTKHLKEKREQDLPFNSRTLWNLCHNLTSTPNPLTISKQGRFWSHLFAEFDPLWGGWRRSEGVGSITGQDLSSLLTGQPLTWENTETECYKNAPSWHARELGQRCLPLNVFITISQPGTNTHTARYLSPGGTVGATSCLETHHQQEKKKKKPTQKTTTTGPSTSSTGRRKMKKWRWEEWKMRQMGSYEIRAEGRLWLINYSQLL